MNILVTGHRGFIGSHMVKALAGHDVETFEWGDPYPGVMDFDWVVHMGAISSTVEQDIDKVLRQNYDFSVKLYEDCKTFGVNFQYSSSASVYGLESTFQETARPDPRTPYAWSKYLFDRYVDRHPAGSIAQGFRYFNVYGNNEEHKKNQASPVTQFRQQARNNGVIKLFENSDQYLRDFVCVEDVVSTHLQFMNSVTESGVWNIGTGNTASFETIARMISEQEQAPVEYIDMPDILKNSYQRYTCADLTKLNRTIGPKKWSSVAEWLNYKNSTIDC